MASASSVCEDACLARVSRQGVFPDSMSFSRGGGGGLSYETHGGVLIYVAGGFGIAGAGGCGGSYAYNSHTGEFHGGAGGSLCYY